MRDWKVETPEISDTAPEDAFEFNGETEYPLPIMLRDGSSIMRFIADGGEWIAVVSDDGGTYRRATPEELEVEIVQKSIEWCWEFSGAIGGPPDDNIERGPNGLEVEDDAESTNKTIN